MPVPTRVRQWRDRLRTAWRDLLARPEGQGRLARGIAAGAFAAMIPAFGLHVGLALLVALLARGSPAVAAAACLLIGNPVTHAAALPAAYEIGRWLLPGPHHGPDHVPAWIPVWLAPLLSAAEETLLGGAVLGLCTATVAFLLARRALARTRPDPGQ